MSAPMGSTPPKAESETNSASPWPAPTIWTNSASPWPVPTVCPSCAHMMRGPDLDDDDNRCTASRIYFHTDGSAAYQLCKEKNDGACKQFQPRNAFPPESDTVEKRSWLVRLIAFAIRQGR